MALEKVRNSHCNMGRLQLKTEEAANFKPTDAAHASIVKKIVTYNNGLKEKLTEYQHIVTTHAIPGITTPTTSELLRKKMSADPWGHKRLARCFRWWWWWWVLGGGWWMAGGGLWVVCVCVCICRRSSDVLIAYKCGLGEFI